MTDEEQASQPGAVATRSDEGPDVAAAEQVFTPQDFRLNLGARLVPDEEPLPNLDNPAIRKLTWEHVVPDRPASSTLSAATTVPLPPPSRVPPPLPPAPATALQPPDQLTSPERFAEPQDAELEVVEDSVDQEVAAEDLQVADEDAFADVGADSEIDEVMLTDPVAETPKPVVVEVEINRLSSIPDLIDDDSPIELPPITPSGSVIAAPHIYTPVLAESFYVQAPQRPPTAVVPMTVAEGKPKRHKTQRRKQKRHPFRTFMTLVVLLGLLAGGAFAAKKYLLHPVNWSAELKPLADGVATERGLEFKLSVHVTELPAADYAHRLASSTIDTTTDPAPVWRALGLLNGEFDLDAIGQQAMNDSPSFYDPATKTIFVSNDLKAFEHLYRFALRRSLTTALLDQQFDWSARLSKTSPAAALGLRATIDGDALAVANALAVSDAPDQLVPEYLSFVQGHGDTISPSPYAAIITGRPGAVMRPTMASLAKDPVSLATLEQATPSNDAVLDVTRLVPTTVSAPPTQGMMFWYYVLASRIDDGQAWSAAARWTSDSLTTSASTPGPCINATFGAADADGAAAALVAFQTWAAVAPVESTTTVTPIDGNQIAIQACDPGAVLTAALPAKVPVVFGGAAVERALVQSALSAAPNTRVDATCLVNAARARGAVFSSPSDDAPVLAVDWQPAYVAANIDLAATCAPAGG
ncbi:MAG TPA: hypothetical protein VNB52_14100 [Ilumatobacteraceae bacterium]|nr:hypothetical protein [Ilumatobacteraceae bacterium]